MEGIYLLVGFLAGVIIAILGCKILMGIFFQLTFVRTKQIFNNWYNRVKLIENREVRELSIEERDELLKNEYKQFMKKTVDEDIIENSELFK